MPKIRKIQTAFTGGEISPRLLSRVDLKLYDNAVNTMLNATPLAHGGAKKRPGTEFLYDATNLNTGNIDKTRMIPFVYSRTQSYVLFFYGNKIFFIKDSGFITTGSPATIYSITHPYTEDEIKELTYAQAGSILFLAHPLHKPKQLIRNADDNWTLSDINFTYNAIADHWFENAYLRFKLITAGNGFNKGDVITITTDGNGNVSSIDETGVTGTGTIAEVSINAALDPAGGQTWTLTCTIAQTNRQEFTVVGSVSGSPAAQWSTNDYPKAVAFYEQRLYFGGSITRPQTIWGSMVGDYTTFTVGPADDDAVQFTIASNRFDTILHLESAKQLLPLTFGSEYSLSGSAQSGITPSAVAIRAHTFHGTTDVKPMRIGSEVIFVQRDGKKLRAISYDITTDSNVAADLTLLAEHITKVLNPVNGVLNIQDMTYQQDPDSIAWVIRSDGVLLSLTHLREQDITAWARHQTKGEYKNVCTIPEGPTDATYLTVKRTINGSTKIYIEKLADVSNITDYYYSDAFAISTNSDNTKTVFKGFNHLIGETVSIIADGKVHPNKTVDSAGQITLDYPANKIIAGIPYSTTIELLHPEVALSDGTAQGRNLSVAKATIRLQDSLGLIVNGIEHPTLRGNVTLDTPPDLYTGDIQVNLKGWRQPFNLKIEQYLPVPFTVLGVVQEVVINE